MSVNSKRILVFLINTACDLSCRYCFYSTGHERRDGVRFDVRNATSVARRLVRLGFTTVVLSGGDPFERRAKQDTFLTIEALQSEGLAVVINTSGASLTEEDCDKILRLSPSRIDFSIDSHLAEVHDAQRGHFAATLTAIKYLLGHGYKSLVTTTVLTKRNIGHIDETIKFLRALGVSECRIQPVYFPEKPLKGKSELDLSLGREDYERLRTIPQTTNNRHFQQYLDWFSYFFQASSDLCSMVCEPVCQMGKRVFVADASGRLSVCFHRNDLELGNLLTSAENALQISLSANALTGEALPRCVGKHCVSLFDSAACWRCE